MVGTWSGTFSSELFVGPGTYQTKNGIRCFVEMSAGDVTIDAIVAPELDSSFILFWDNPNRFTLTFNGTFPFDAPGIPAPVSTFDLRTLRGTIAFTFTGTKWELFSYSTIGSPLHLDFGALYTPRNTNGLCTILDKTKNVIDVERTGLGLLTVRLDPGTLTPTTAIDLQANVTGLIAENSVEQILVDKGMVTPDVLLLNTGFRDKNGKFSDDDLVQDPANSLLILGQTIP